MSRPSPCIWLDLYMLLLLWQARFCFCLASQSSLCKFMDMPCSSESPEMCQMKYYRLNSTECRDMVFDDRLPRKLEGNNEFGNVELKSYYYNILTFKMTAFNLSFSHVKWKHIKFRFKQIGNDMKNTCREFFILPNATVNNLYYDCIWSNEAYEGKPFFFEYEASNELVKVYEKFSFHVPFAKNVDENTTQIEDWETFTYVEVVSVSNGLGPTAFFLYWQPLPKKFLIESYNISVWSNDTGILELVHSAVVTCNCSRDCTYMYKKWYGTLQFGVRPLSADALCSTTFTILFQFGGERAKPLLIGLISATFIVSIALYILYIMRKYKAMNEVKIPKTIPKLLFIYSSSISCHVNVILNLAEYLKNYCSVEPLVDELHIFTSKSRDPFKWCNESFKSADYVMVIASPYSINKRMSESVYKNTDVLLLRFLREGLSARHSKTKFFVLMLPYSTEKDIPFEVQNLRRFQFPRDLNKILTFIHENRAICNIFARELCGGKRDYKLHGKKLSVAIEEAQQQLRKNVLDGDGNWKENGADGEIDSDHELLTQNGRNSSQEESGIWWSESMRKMVRENFLEYPRPFENINLLGEEEEEFSENGENIVRLERMNRIQNSINIDELNL